MNNLKEIAGQLIKKDNFILIGHAIPDGDCIGSLLGLYLGLQSLGKKVQVVLQDPVPPIYYYLPCVENIEKANQPVEGNTIVFLDCSDIYRVGDTVLNILPDNYTSINIDHHQTNDLFATFNYVNSLAAATAEIIYELLMHMGVEINTDIANVLYAGIVMDTGNFKYSNTTSLTLRTAADLLDKGVDLDMTRISLFESKPYQEVLLLRQALQHIEISDDGKIAWMTLSYDEVSVINAHNLHPEGIINYTRMIKGVEVGLLFREINPGIVKIGFRSKGQIDVSLLARDFNGGGHKQAAGAQQEGSLEEVKNSVINKVRDVIN